MQSDSVFPEALIRESVGDVRVAATTASAATIEGHRQKSPFDRLVIARLPCFAMAMALGVLTNFPTDLPLEIFPNVSAHLGIIPYFAVPACILAHAAGITILRTERVTQYLGTPH